MQWGIVILPLQLVAVLIAAISHLDFDQNMVLPESIDLDLLLFGLQQKKPLVDLSRIAVKHLMGVGLESNHYHPTSTDRLD